MPILKKDVPAPLLPEPRAVAVPELGGEVLVCPLTLSGRLAMGRESTQRYGHVATLLTYCVMAANNEPLFTLDEWEAWGALHYDAAVNLFSVAHELSFPKPEVTEKNSAAPSSS